MVNQTMIHSLLVVALLSTTICATKSSNGLILEMIHRDSPNSPLYRANLTNSERMKMYIKMSTARLKSFRRSHMKSLNPNEGIIRPKLITQELSYLVQVGIGTFVNEFPTSRTYYLQLDTGSELTWTQCEGCINCLDQRAPMFPASQSASYLAIPCKDCTPGSICRDGKCTIDVDYVEGSKLLATVAMEDFTFASQGETSHIIDNFIFGCGFDMQNFDEDKDPNNKVSGIMGMSDGYYGFMEQTKLIFDGKFSYCLQPIFTEGTSLPMYLRFGNDVVPQPIQMQATPIYKNKGQWGYYLRLFGISVDNRMLPINPKIFEIKTDGTGGCVIDSGSTTSWIIAEAFDIVKGAVILFIKDHNDNWRKMRTAPPELAYELCFQRYKLPKTINLPKITFHLNNANFEIDGEESFSQEKLSTGEDVVCLQYFRNNVDDHDDGVTYLGALQQVNKRIVYDLQNSLLHFGPADCSKEN